MGLEVKLVRCLYQRIEYVAAGLENATIPQKKPRLRYPTTCGIYNPNGIVRSMTASIRNKDGIHGRKLKGQFEVQN